METTSIAALMNAFLIQNMQEPITNACFFKVVRSSQKQPKENYENHAVCVGR